jgi:hypothetical protein
MDYILFYNYEDGTKVFGYYGDYEEVKKAYDDAVEHYKKHKVAVEVGFAEIQKTQTFNWPE